MTKKTLCFDSEKCVGCHACVVACADQNDTDVLAGEPLFRRVEHYERLECGEVRISHVSLGCMHCEGAECLDACPSGALRRDASSGAVIVRAELCIGCHACAFACPFGVPRFGSDAVMSKCDGCFARTRFGYDPACAEVCPTGALAYLDVNDQMAAKQKRFGRTLA